MDKTVFDPTIFAVKKGGENSNLTKPGNFLSKGASDQSELACDPEKRGKSERVFEHDFWSLEERSV